LFFALKGDHFNGNEFAAKAIENGAAFAIIDQQVFAAGSKFIVVDDVLTTLQQLARFHRDRLKIPVIGITGSNGKTTTKELTGCVLAKKYKTISTRGNLNNHIGVPLSVLSLNAETEIAVIEMGANHCGEIAWLCRIANPDFGIITNIGKAHLEGFGGYEGVIRAKSELYDHIRSVGGKLFVNLDDPLLIRLSQGIETITYGKSADAGIKGEISGEFPMLTVDVEINGEKITINSQLIGSYNFHNILVAAAIGSYFGVEMELIREAIEAYTPENNRSQFVRTHRNQIVMDAYNANPSSMEAAITHFAKSPAPEKVLILGDMLELGDESLAEHQRILGLASGSGAKQILLVGSQFHQVNHDQGNWSFFNADEALEFLSKNMLSGKTILVKGSRGIRLEKLLPFL
jgi:UDP-N-acetylmuramoyl-tripeptide--D-alanyl-D-alanine ligase